MTEERFAVRPVREDDLNEWFRLRSLLWDEMPVEDHKEEMVDIIEHTDSQFVAVADLGDGRLAGFLEASIRPFVDDCSSENVGYLEGWYVDSDFRRQGIGTAMVSMAETWARTRGCTEMASDAEIDNSGSIGAHRDLGYFETSRLVHFRKDLI
ncbi:MAG: aminoglycoside 6'-N-acetyltransferase [Acidobacteriota bacterium]